MHLLALQTCHLQRVTEYHNFVKPHMALEGKTPAQVAGIDVKGWKELLKLSVKKSE